MREAEFFSDVCQQRDRDSESMIAFLMNEVLKKVFLYEVEETFYDHDQAKLQEQAAKLLSIELGNNNFNAQVVVHSHIFGFTTMIDDKLKSGYIGY